VWFAGIAVGPMRRRVSSISADERDVIGLCVDFGRGVVQLVDRAGATRFYTLDICVGLEAAPRDEVPSDAK